MLQRKNILLLAFLLFSLSLFSQQFKIATLNCEWLSCLTNGPSNRALQMNNIAQVITNVDADIIALQEVGTSTSFATIDELVTILNTLGSGWAGNIVPWASNPSNCGQYQAVVYKTSKIQRVSSSLITNGGSSQNWASGRYPVRYDVNFFTNEGIVPVTLINIHAKAYSDYGSYARRAAASQSLKQLLDGSAYRTRRIILIGDYNDYLIGTICRDCPPNVTDSPYKNFMDDTPNYRGLTQYVYNGRLIDNIIISNELFANYVANSAVRDVDSTSDIYNYLYTTSDHYPITALLRFGNYSDIDEIEETPQFIIFPNPATTELTINNGQLTINNVEIIDIAGKTLTANHYKLTTTIDVSSLASGIYILKIATEKGIFTQKFVKR